MKTKQIIILSVMGLLAYGCGDHKSAEKQISATADETGYKLATLKKAAVQQNIKLPAQLAAYQQVSIFPKVNGYVKSVLVDIGSHVKAGQTLMVIEAPEIEQQTNQAKEKYMRSRSDYEIDRDNYLRLKVASKTAGAISPMDLATAKAKMASDSSLSNAEKANWQAAQAMMAYLVVKAPFTGVITQRNAHPGDLVSTEGKGGSPMLELKQIAHLRLQADVPEGIAGGLQTGDKVDFYLSAFPNETMTAKVARKADDVNVNYRTERVEMDVWNNNEKLSPGMFAEVSFQATGNPNAFMVPKAAIVTATDRKYIIAVNNGKAQKVDVSTGNESADDVEVTGNLQAGEQVLANGNDEITDGQPIK